MGTVWSPDPLASIEPSGEKSSENTKSAWPES
jgi:hypothetical protein